MDASFIKFVKKWIGYDQVDLGFYVTGVQIEGS